jgi:hypothetical protein
MFYYALDFFAKFLEETNLSNSKITVCGKMSPENLMHEIAIFKYFFPNNLCVSLSSGFWHPCSLEIISQLYAQDIHAQVMLDVEHGPDGFFVRSSEGTVGLDLALDRFEALRSLSRAPLHLHVCSVRKAGMLGVDFDLLTFLERRALNRYSGDMIYSGGVRLDGGAADVLKRFGGAVNRVGINNEILRHPPKMVVDAILGTS